MIVRAKPDVQQGSMHNGNIKHYVCFGYRKHPKSSGVLGQYAFKTNVPNNIARNIK
jgi:hypothetical protein